MAIAGVVSRNKEDEAIWAKIWAAEETVKQQARDSYLRYVEYVHEGRWKASRFHSHLCNAVQEFIEKEGDPAYDILILEAPPQNGKSQAVTETLPSWFLGKWPRKRVIEASYNETFAETFGRANRRKIDAYGEELFGIRLAKTPNSATEFQLENGIGGMISRGILSGITGKSGDLVIVDDPVKNRADADSLTFRDAVWNEWLNSIRTRLQARSKVIVIATRWHPDDMIGRLIATERNITRLTYPVECLDPETDLLGREAGEALCPEIGKGQEWLESFRESYVASDGMRAWNALFLQQPTDADGNMVKREWWRWRETLPRLPFVCISVDAAFKETKKSDFVSIQAWGKYNATCVLISKDTRRMNFQDTLVAVEAMVGRVTGITGRGPDCVLIEDKANGSAIISVLRERISGVIPVTPKESKEARLQAVLPMLEAGQVELWKNCVGAGDLIEQAAAFPNGVHDDDVDAMSQALNRLRNVVAVVPEEKKAADFFGIFADKDEDNDFLGGQVTQSYLFGGF